VTVAAEVGDMARFENPKQLMSFLGLSLGEHSSGRTTRPRGITKAGNPTVRSLLFEAAWSYRHTPKVGSYMAPPRAPGFATGGQGHRLEGAVAALEAVPAVARQG
jgi:transposase